MSLEALATRSPQTVPERAHEPRRNARDGNPTSSLSVARLLPLRARALSPTRDTMTALLRAKSLTDRFRSRSPLAVTVDSATSSLSPATSRPTPASRSGDPFQSNNVSRPTSPLPSPSPRNADSPRVRFPWRRTFSNASLALSPRAFPIPPHFPARSVAIEDCAAHSRNLPRFPRLRASRVASNRHRRDLLEG